MSTDRERIRQWVIQRRRRDRLFAFAGLAVMVVASLVLLSWIGTILVMLLTALTAIPLGLGAAIYLEEYAPKNWMTDLIEINITNLAGVPSIVYGLMALGLLVYEFHL